MFLFLNFMWFRLFLLYFFLFLLLIHHLKIFHNKWLCTLNNCFVLVKRLWFRLNISNIQNLSLNSSTALTLLFHLLFFVYSCKRLLFLGFRSSGWHFNYKIVGRITNWIMHCEGMGNWSLICLRVQIRDVHLRESTLLDLRDNFGCSFGLIRLLASILGLVSLLACILGLIRNLGGIFSLVWLLAHKFSNVGLLAHVLALLNQIQICWLLSSSLVNNLGYWFGSLVYSLSLIWLFDIDNSFGHVGLGRFISFLNLISSKCRWPALKLFVLFKFKLDTSFVCNLNGLFLGEVTSNELGDGIFPGLLTNNSLDSFDLGTVFTLLLFVVLILLVHLCLLRWKHFESTAIVFLFHIRFLSMFLFSLTFFISLLSSFFNRFMLFHGLSNFFSKALCNFR